MASLCFPKSFLAEYVLACLAVSHRTAQCSALCHLEPVRNGRPFDAGILCIELLIELQIQDVDSEGGEKSRANQQAN